MTINERILDSEILWRAGRREGALLSVLVAVAAAATKKYPRMGDRERFEKFISESSNVKISAEFRSKLYTVETLLYKFMRCELLHEGGLPPDILFVDEESQNAMSVRAGGHPEYLLKMGVGWYFYLARLASH